MLLMSLRTLIAELVVGIPYSLKLRRLDAEISRLEYKNRDNPWFSPVILNAEYNALADDANQKYNRLAGHAPQATGHES